MTDPWTSAGVPVPKAAARPHEPVRRQLTPQEMEACEAILSGDTPTVAYRRETGNESSTAFSSFIKNDEVRYYLAARRMELRLKEHGDVDPADEWLRQMRAQAYMDPAEFLAEGAPRSPEDILKWPEHIRRAVSGYKWDRMGNFVVEFVDKKAAQDMLARYWGLYQADRINDRDVETNLIASGVWRFVMSLHLYKGTSIAEGYMLARREPEKVDAWVRAHPALEPGEIVVDDPEEGDL